MFIRLCLVLGLIMAVSFVAAFPHAFWWVPAVFVSSSLSVCLFGLIFLFVCSLFCYGKKRSDRDNAFCRFLAYYTMDAILTIFRFRIRGEDLEKVPNEPCVIVCNHLSRFDPMVTFVLLKKRLIGFVSKKENMKIPIAGPILSKIGFLPLDRENPLRSMRTIHAAGRLVSEQGYTMGIYPEGTRNRGEGLLEFKTGAFVMAKKAKCPIVISTIRGTNAYRGRFPWRSTDVCFSVLSVIPAETVSSAKPEVLSDLCRDAMLQELS